MDYVKTDESMMGKLKAFKDKDEALVVEFNNEWKKNKDQEGMRNK